MRSVHLTSSIDGKLKDEKLFELSQSRNVARFLSFAPVSTELRASVIDRPIWYGERNTEAGSWHTHLARLLGAVDSVNVRTFLGTESKSTDFIYGLTSVSEVEALVTKYSVDGFYTIVNETIDVRDGGISGVALGSIVEFAPSTTPRGVEKKNNFVARMPLGIAKEILRLVYGFEVDLDDDSVERVEFSVHPMRVGLRLSHMVYWEATPVPHVKLDAVPSWPNEFSRFLGDKLFGLLMAQSLGFSVPYTSVVSRNVAPFAFGKRTGTGEHWIRTCPAIPEPGRLTTMKGWIDPWTLLAKEDPDGRVPSILGQESVDAQFSGAGAYDTSQDEPLIEGVRGHGDKFMLGGRVVKLPDCVREDVSDVLHRLSEAFGGASIEWAHDGRQVWVLQLHARSTAGLEPGVLNPGEADSWIPFDPDDGLDVLRSIVAEAVKSGRLGIEVLGSIGITSHVGDIVRNAGVPARLR